MNVYPVTPIGVQEVVSAVAGVCANRDAHKRCGLAPPHFVIRLDAGNGQTTVTRFIAETFAQNGLRRFGGLDLFLEYTLDGTLPQMRQVFADIDACAVYTNGFEGVVAVDITALSEYAEEEQAAFFLEGIEKVGRSATVILYTGAAPSRGLSSLVERFKSAARSVCDIRPGAYTPEELARIAERQLDKHSVALEGYEELHGALCDVMRARGCRTVKHAAAVVETAVKAADFSHYVPALSAAQLKSAFADVFAHEKGEAR